MLHNNTVNGVVLWYNLIITWTKRLWRGKTRNDTINTKSLLNFPSETHYQSFIIRCFYFIDFKLLCFSQTSWIAFIQRGRMLLQECLLGDLSSCLCLPPTSITLREKTDAAAWLLGPRATSKFKAKEMLERWKCWLLTLLTWNMWWRGQLIQ